MENIKTFRIRGSFKKRGMEQTFTKEVSSISQDMALDKVLSLMGSNHKVKRAQVEILNIEEVKAE